MAWSGGSVVEVPAAYSSQTCSTCGCVDALSRPQQAVFSCSSCGYRDHADLNAAKVLLARANRSGDYCGPRSLMIRAIARPCSFSRCSLVVIPGFESLSHLSVSRASFIRSVRDAR